MEPGTPPSESVFATLITTSEFIVVLLIQAIAAIVMRQSTFALQRTLKIIDFGVIAVLVGTAIGVMVRSRRGSVL